MSPRSLVVATAGHVDHGKTALIRALTGQETDRWAEERRRGLTLDLGYAWTDLPTGDRVAFVDVPGHARFIGNMLAGVGPVPVVLLVVAADEGWREQSAEHLDALVALDVRHGLLAVTRSDLADPAPAAEQARAALAGTGLAGIEDVAVSARTGEGIADLRAALGRLVAQVPAAPAEDRVRLWVDRSFTVSGAGTVATGTLASGTLRVGDRLQLGDREVAVRGLQSRETDQTEVGPVARVAVNLRQVAADDVPRGSALVTPGAWPRTAQVDVRRTSGPAFTDSPAALTVHAGTAAVAARVRPLDAEHARLTLAEPLWLAPGDRLVLRDTGTARVHGGAQVLDVDPPALRRRGAARRWADRLASATIPPDAVAEVRRRGAMPARRLALLGADPGDPRLVRGGDWVTLEPVLTLWADRLRGVHADERRDQPLSPGPTTAAAARAIRLPDVALLDAVARRAGLVVRDGRVTAPEAPADLGPAEASVAELERRLGADPFAAPEAGDLDALGLGPRELAAAARAGRLLRVRASPADVVLLPDAVDRARATLAGLPQPFTLSEARQALGTTRRVAVPLLEHLDSLGVTRRVDGTRRELR